MMGGKTAWLFPGPGAHLPGVLGPLADGSTAVQEALTATDSVAREYGWEPVSPWLTGAEAGDDPGPEQRPGLLWLGFFATSVALAELLKADGAPCDVLVGHSGGEITALAVAGSLTVDEAARVLCERIRALSGSEPAAGAMVAVDIDAERLGHACAAVGDHSLAVAVDNAPRQSVASGHVSAVAVLERMAGAADWRTSRLPMTYLLHNPLLSGPARTFLDAVSGITPRPPRQPVYSPLLGRYVTDAPDVREVLERHLVQRVGWRGALADLYREGTDTFVECGARQVLANLVGTNLPAAARAVPVLPQRRGRDELRLLAESLAKGAEPEAVVAPPAPQRQSQAEAEAVTAPEPVADTGTPADGTDSAPTLPPDDRVLLGELRTVYADVLQYPPEVFTDDADLEAELGVSSIKQTEIFARLLDRYDLPTPSSDVRVSAYRTLPRIAGLLRDLAGKP